MEYKRTFNFGKVDYNGTGCKTHAVEIEMELEVKEGLPIFTASGSVWNTMRTDIVQGGQCIDSVWQEFATQIKEPSLYKNIMGLWERNHLNDMNAGCEHQRAEKWEDKLIDPSKPKTQDNMRSWQSVKEGGLLGAPCKKCGYKYGTEWKYRAISKEDLKIICSLLKIDILERKKIFKI